MAKGARSIGSRRSPRHGVDERLSPKSVGDSLGERGGSGWSEVWRGRVRVRWVSRLMLVPVMLVGVVLTMAFFRTLSSVLLPEFRGRGQNVLWVSLGSLSWLMALCLGKIFTGRMWGLRVYVLAHELTHLVWTFLSGGRGRLERVGLEGGAMVTDRTNLMIVLAPYFYPLLSVVVVMLAPLVNWVGEHYSVSEIWQVRCDCLLYWLVGFTLSHHYTFTLYVLPRGQTDFKYYGRAFSLAVIWVMNVVVLTIALLMVPRIAPFGIYSAELVESFGMVSDWLVPIIDWLINLGLRALGAIWHLFRGGISASSGAWP